MIVQLEMGILLYVQRDDCVSNDINQLARAGCIEDLRDAFVIILLLAGNGHIPVGSG